MEAGVTLLTTAKRLKVCKRVVGECKGICVEGPVLTRKSAPSSIIVKKLQQTFPSDDDSPMLPLTAEFIDEEMESDEDVTPSTANSLYMRDKW